MSVSLDNFKGKQVESSINNETSFINLKTAFNAIFQTLKAGDGSPPEQHGECPAQSRQLPLETSGL